MSTTGRLRLAKITSGIGALVTGIGLGATFGVRLAGLGALRSLLESQHVHHAA